MSAISQGSNDEFVDPLANYEPREYDDPLEEALEEKSVTEIEGRPYVAVPATITVKEALGKLAGEDIACLMVEDQGKLVGIFSDRDILDKVALEFERARDRPVRELMSADPVYVYQSDSAAAALSVMAVSGYRHVPVVSLDGSIQGIVSPQRVTKFLREHWQ